ncbi:recombinase family protein, partial [Pseudomonas aeruginosa]|uniref:recombinase family protein n=1 Tax=Pseudomonas aeruginosa TaxID=287 RepID=UPI002B2341AA
MQGHRIGYVRVSSFDQNPERQLEQTQVSKVFTDKASGKDTQRPQLEALLSFVREGDTVVVHSMDRLARNLDDRHCCKVSDEAAFCLIQRPYISKTLL